MAKSLSDALFSKVRQRVLGVLYSRDEEAFHLREIARMTGLSAPTVRNEVDSLVDAGIAKDFRQGNQRLFRASKECPIFFELKGIARKTFGIADRIKVVLDEIDGIDAAFIFGSIAREADRSDSDVDLFIIGECSHRKLLAALQPVSESICREINPQVYTRPEFDQRVIDGNSFIKRIMEEPKIVLKGEIFGIQAA